MKQIILLIAMLAILFSGCHETTVGYLITENASYTPDSLYIRLTPDPEKDALRIKNKSAWASLDLQGYEGTLPIFFSVESVTSNQGEEAAAAFMQQLSIRGGGALLYPFENSTTAGIYKVSIRLTNEGYSQVLTDAMTIIVEP